MAKLLEVAAVENAMELIRPPHGSLREKTRLTAKTQRAQRRANESKENTKTAEETMGSLREDRESLRSV